MHPVTATDFHHLVKPSDPQLSPDGGRIAFVRSVPDDDETYESTVYVVNVDSDSDPRQFTVAEGVDTTPRWSPSGDRLAFVSTRGADDDRPQLWVMPTDGGEARQVTDVPGGVVGPVWSPDGTRIAFTQATTEAEREAGLDLDIGREDEYERETPDPRVVDRLVYRQAAKYIDGTRSHVYVLDLESADLTRLTDGDFDHTAAEWGDETTLYYASKRTEETDDSVVVDILASDTTDGGEELVTQTTGWGAVLSATEDGRVAYPRTPEEGLSMRQTDLEVYDRGTDEVTVLTAGLDRTVDLTAGLSWDPAEERLCFVTPDEGCFVVRAVGSDGADCRTVVADGHTTGFSVGDEAVALVRSEWDHPGDVFLASRSGDDAANTTRLTHLNADYLADHEIREPEELRYDADGNEIQGWVLTPPGFDERAEDETYPLAVEIHGGPHAMWSTAGTMWHEFQTLAARGYVVFWSNPRGSTGYGEAHSMAIERNWGDVTMTDVMAGVDHVCERDYVDTDDAFVTGGSFGGFMTGWIVGHTDFFDGAVAQRGVYELSSFYGSTDAFKLVEWDFGTTPWDDPTFLWEQSPAAHVGGVTTPTLVVHADNDYRVPVNNGELFYLFLKKQGVDTRLVRYPREGHELSRSGEPGHIVDRIERIVRWFDGYSSHHDVPRALDRGDDGLSAGESADEDDADAGDEGTE